MLVTNGSPQRARWAVMWIYVKSGKRKLFRKDFGDDYASAEELYLKAKIAGKPYATLACVNMGFPPPDSLRPKTVRKRGKIRGTKKFKTITLEVDPLKELNVQGKLWCPYCRQLRDFVSSHGFEVRGVKVREFRYICPICKISHRDHNVRVWNSTAAIHMESAVSARRSRRSPVQPTPRRRRKTRA